jgi:hypothetical protein
MVARCLSIYFYIIHKMEREREREREGRRQSWAQEKREEEGWGPCRVCADKHLKFIQACK